MRKEKIREGEKERNGMGRNYRTREDRDDEKREGKGQKMEWGKQGLESEKKKGGKDGRRRQEEVSL